MPRILGLSLATAGMGAVWGFVVGLGTYTFHYAEGTSYLSDDPRACITCHIMRPQYEGWQKSSHHAVATCNDCHVPADPIGQYVTKLHHGYRHSKAFTLQNFHEPIRITPADLTIVENNCVRCHQALVQEITAHAPAGSAPAGCTRCHSDAGHGPRR